MPPTADVARAGLAVRQAQEPGSEVDGSIFVTAAAVNPTNTIQALALHIADTIKRNLSTLFD